MINNEINSKRLTNKQTLECILLALILNMNSIRIIFGNKIGSIIAYSIYILFVILLFIKSIKKRYISINKNIIVISGFVIVAISLISLLIRGKVAYLSTWIKFLVSILIGINASTFSIKQIKITFKYIVFTGGIYSIYILNNISRLQYLIKHMPDQINYLVVTLPLGVTLTATLIFIFYSKKLKMKIIYFISSIVLLAALFNFQARANLIFPIIITVFILLISVIKKPSNLIKLILGVLVGVIVLRMSIQYLDVDKLILRLSRLFNETESEPRVLLYFNYWKYITEDFRWIVGIGFNESKNALSAMHMIETYPHNFILEIFGELGVVGLLCCISIILKIYQYIISILGWMLKNLRNVNERQFIINKDEKIISCNLVISCFIFYFLTYFKSYSIYDAYQLFSITGFVVAIYTELFSKKINYKKLIFKF